MIDHRFWPIGVPCIGQSDWFRGAPDVSQSESFLGFVQVEVDKRTYVLLKDTDPLLLEAVSLHTEKAFLRQEEMLPGETGRNGRWTEHAGHLWSPDLVPEGPLRASFSSET